MNKISSDRFSVVEKIVFFVLLPIMFLLMFFALVVAIVGTSQELTGFFGFVGSVVGLIYFVVIPCVVITMLLLVVFIYNEKRNRAQLRAAQQAICQAEEQSAVQDVPTQYEPFAVTEAQSIEPQPAITEAQPAVEESVKAVEQPIEERKPVKPAAPRSKPQLADALKAFEELKEKKKLTPKMIMSCASKLEGFKNKPECKTPAKQAKIKDALNWCYDKLGRIAYDN